MSATSRSGLACHTATKVSVVTGASHSLGRAMTLGRTCSGCASHVKGVASLSCSSLPCNSANRWITSQRIEVSVGTQLWPATGDTSATPWAYSRRVS
jgi:hypothetical protein